MRTIELRNVRYIPNQLEPGILYVSKKFKVAAHLCPCGCASKIITPLGKNEWNFSHVKNKASLSPSVGNWQLACKSHYWIKNGEIVWSYQISNEEISELYDYEQRKREHYFGQTKKKSKRLWLEGLKFWAKSNLRL